MRLAGIGIGRVLFGDDGRTFDVQVAFIDMSAQTCPVSETGRIPSTRNRLWSKPGATPLPSLNTPCAFEKPTDLPWSKASAVVKGPGIPYLADKAGRELVSEGWNGLGSKNSAETLLIRWRPLWFSVHSPCPVGQRAKPCPASRDSCQETRLATPSRSSRALANGRVSTHGPRRSG